MEEQATAPHTTQELEAMSWSALQKMVRDLNLERPKNMNKHDAIALIQSVSGGMILHWLPTPKKSKNQWRNQLLLRSQVLFLLPTTRVVGNFYALLTLIHRFKTKGRD